MSPNSIQSPSQAFIAVGSNIDPEDNIIAALILLTGRTRVKRSSTFYRTEPIGSPGQPEFVNGLWQIEAGLGPVQIRDDLLRPIEDELGRIRSADKFVPRVIDLDLVLYGDFVADNGTLKLPHPDIVRPFVHIPLMELGLSGFAA